MKLTNETNEGKCPQHTRKPVDDMVSAAKELESSETLPLLRLTVTEKGVAIIEANSNNNKSYTGGFYPIEVIR